VTALSLLDWRPTIKGSLTVGFADWLAENPRVYGEVVRMAREWRAIHGRTARVGIATLWEALRWQSSLYTRGDEFKLNNSYRAPMARLVMQREPDLIGVFETRERRQERAA
jgi:hypothetical protein